MLARMRAYVACMRLLCVEKSKRVRAHKHMHVSIRAGVKATLRTHAQLCIQAG